MKDQEKERNGNPFLNDEDDMLISADSDQSDDQMDKKKSKNCSKKRHGHSRVPKGGVSFV